MESGAAAAATWIFDNGLRLASSVGACRTFKHFGDITTQNVATETFYDTTGRLQENKVRALARTYAQIVAGRPTDVLFNATTAVFHLQYASYEAIGGNTTIFLSKEHYYPSGYQISIDPPTAAWSVLVDEAAYAVLAISHDRAAMNDGDPVSVAIGPAA